ncbi:MAG: glycine oxidase maturase GoxB [Martelella sp.]|uniref:glycine oxidase maturase GoxB n=1 Tax=Martelella sp. TaxID=1969699 RepID=UPI00324251D1
MKQTRVIVVGGGIAAMAASLSLANEGVPAIWIAPEGFAKAKPGESLAPAAVPLLRALGLDAILETPMHRKVEVLFSSWGANSLIEKNQTGCSGNLGYVINRTEFEFRLSEEVAKRPAIDRCVDAVASVQRLDEAWHVTTCAGLEFTADFLIDGSGRHMIVGRQYATLSRQDKLVAAYDFLEQENNEVDPTPATLVEAVPNGWWYAALLEDKRLALNYYSDPDLMPRGLGHDVEAWKTLIGESRYIGRWLESAGFAIDNPPCLTSAGTTFLSTPTGPGWIAIGDAAAAFDPLSSHGMTLALWTGVEGAKAAAKSLSGSPDSINQYQERVVSGISRYMSDRRRIYGREHRFTEHAFWRRRQAYAD